MRMLLLLIAAMACGNVKHVSPPDAAPVDTATPDAPATSPPDAMDLCDVAVRSPPPWQEHGPFVPAPNPDGSHGLVWKSSGPVPDFASISLPFMAGERIAGASFTAYGNGSSAGLEDIQVIYQPDAMSPYQVLAKGNDLGRKSQWGTVAFVNFQHTDLTGGRLWVQFVVTEQDYYIGTVTTALERPCPTH